MLTAERLREVLDYDPATGEFRWRVDVCNHKAGTIAGGYAANGYLQIGIDRKIYRSHRLAWLYVHGQFPDCEVDHINRKRDDNRLANLRLASSLENKRNASIKSSNTSGVPGVNFHKLRQKWRAFASMEGKAIHIGLFLTMDEAIAARTAFVRQHFGAFANT